MNVSELKEYAKVMKEFQITHLKMEGIHIHMETSMPVPEVLPDTMPPVEGDPIQHKVEQMNSLLKLNDTELVDRLFPVKEEEM